MTENKKIVVYEVPVEVKQVIAEIDEKNPDNNREVSEKQLLVKMCNDIEEIKIALGLPATK
jgi:hypothetical protein